MPFEFWAALAAGAIGGIVMVILRTIMKILGMDLKMDISRVWGTMMGLQGNNAMAVGLMMHIVVSAAIALVYALFFDLLGIESALWFWGLIGGAIHWAIAGMFMVMLPAMHPYMPERSPEPGAFVTKLGSPDVPVFVIGHLVYGLTVGIVYAYLHSDGGTDIAF